VNDEPLFRIERGHAEPDELAAVVAVLLARAAGPRGPGDAAGPRRAVRWRRLERQSGFGAAHSWQTTA
jgi:hypothetical protein